MKKATFVLQRLPFFVPAWVWGGVCANEREGWGARQFDKLSDRVSMRGAVKDLGSVLVASFERDAVKDLSGVWIRCAERGLIRCAFMAKKVRIDRKKVKCRVLGLRKTKCKAALLPKVNVHIGSASI